LISDEDFAQGVASIERDAEGERESQPIIDRLDLLVLR
jgi:hypothetical protein